MGDDWARPVVHWEIEALDAERQRAFYGELFHWEIGDGPIMPIPAGLGGPEPGPAGHVRQGTAAGSPSTSRCATSAPRSPRPRSSGGTVISEPFDIPGGPTLAPITDPEGNPVMLVQQ